MASQLMKAPVILQKNCATKEQLERLGDVSLTEEGWVLEYTCRVGYYGDDEGFIYDFWHSVGGLLDNKDLIRFDWDRFERVKRPLP